MKLGVVFPQTEIGTDPDRIRNYARGVEDEGFDHLVAYDHVFGHRPDDPAAWADMGPYTNEHEFHEIFVLFAHLAAITTRLEFATEVLVLPQRQTVLVAKQAAELQLLSGGRLRLGIGVGWNYEEFRALGMNFHDRGKRVVEQIHLLRRLWTDELITLDTEFHTISGGAIKPRPVQPIPIWIGGYAPVALKRAAALADGLMLEHSLQAAPAVISSLRQDMIAAGRDPAAFGLAVRIQLRDGELDAAIAEAQAWERVGVTHLSVTTMDEGVDDPDDHLRLAVAFKRVWERSSHVAQT
jgi:probable F420-dependent oxidoreductase